MICPALPTTENLVVTQQKKVKRATSKKNIIEIILPKPMDFKTK